MRLLFSVILFSVSLSVAAQEATAYYGFALGKSRYYVLTELPDVQSPSALTGDVGLTLHFERVRGGVTRSEYDDLRPSNCVARKNSAGVWLEVICAAATDSPLNDVSFHLSADISRRRGAPTLICRRGCRAEVPARINLFVPDDS
jgi:hypothetical protein